MRLQRQGAEYLRQSQNKVKLPMLVRQNSREREDHYDMAQNTQSHQPETLSTFQNRDTITSPHQRYTTFNENRFKSNTQNKLDRIRNIHQSNLFKLPIKTTRSKYRDSNPNQLDKDSEVVIEPVQKFDMKEFMTIHSTSKPPETVAIQEPIAETNKPMMTLVTNPDEEAQRGLKEYQQKTILTLSKTGESIDMKETDPDAS